MLYDSSKSEFTAWSDHSRMKDCNEFAEIEKGAVTV